MIPVAIIGAGNLAFNLGLALYKHGFNVIQVYSRTNESAKTLAEKINTEWTTDIETITDNAAIYFVVLKDSVLQELIPKLTKGRESGLWVHTAGSIPMDIWKGFANHYGVFYPMQTFSKQREVDFSKIAVFIEASTHQDVETLKSVALTLTSKVFEIDSQQRKKLHLAAVFACNFVNHMYNLSNDVLKEAKIPFDTMLPLIDETARKVHELSPQEAQTGPAVRYDKNVIDSHLDLLKTNPDMQEIYRIISKSIHQHRSESQSMF